MLRAVCPAPVTTTALTTAGAPVSFPLATATGGLAPATVTCTPPSGQTFPLGRTAVTCTAQDAAGASASCTFDVTLTLVPRLTRTRFLAFGDSVTAGEVTSPVVSTVHGERMFRRVVVPSSSYPTVLSNLLSRRYAAQLVSVVNAGREGQFAVDAVPRFTSTLSSTQAEVVLFLMGYNDIQSPRDVSNGLLAVDRMAKETRARGARLFLATLTPSIQGRPRALDPQLTATYNSGIRILANGEGAVLVDLFNTLLPDAANWIGSDGLHPTEAGYGRIAELFFNAIQGDLEVR